MEKKGGIRGDFFRAELGEERGKVCFFTNGVQAGQTELDGLIEGGGAQGEMAHLPTRASLSFAVEVEGGGREGKEGSPIGLAVIPEVSQKVRHGGGAMGGDGAEGEPADGANLLFELAGGAGFGGEVAGIVDPGREFIDPKGARGKFKEFDRKQADEIEFPGNLFGKLGGLTGGGRGNSGGKKSLLENSVLMTIFKGKVGDGLAGGIAGDDERKFTDEGDMFLEDGAGGLELRPSRDGIGGGRKGELAFAVVTEGGRFEAGFARKSFEGGGQFGGGGDDEEAGRRKT